jgi:hypothetical protein
MPIRTVPLILFWIAWCTTFSSASHKADKADSSTPLTWLQKSATPRALMQLEIDGTAQWAYGKGAQRSRDFRLVCTYMRDGQRLDIQTTRFEGGKPISGWRSIIDGSYISYQVPPRGSTALSGLYATDGSRFIGAAIPSAWGGFEGYAAGDYQSLADVLGSGAPVQLSQESIDGSPCMLLQMDSPQHGRYQAWLDPELNYLPRKLVVQKTAGDLMGNQSLSQWTRISPPGSRGIVGITAVSYTMDQTMFERVQGRWFPLACHVTRVQTFADGNSEITTMTGRRTRLVLDPDLSNAFRPKLRQGARLANQVDQHLPYQWKDGAAVPLVDHRVVKQMDETAAELKNEASHTGGERR